MLRMLKCYEEQGSVHRAGDISRAENKADKIQDPGWDQDKMGWKEVSLRDGQRLERHRVTALQEAFPINTGHTGLGVTPRTDG